MDWGPGGMGEAFWRGMGRFGESHAKGMGSDMNKNESEFQKIEKSNVFSNTHLSFLTRLPLVATPSPLFYSRRLADGVGT